MKTKLKNPDVNEAIHNFLLHCSPWKHDDMVTAIETCNDIDKHYFYLVDAIDTYGVADENAETNYKSTDINYCLYRRILNDSREKIKALTGYDINSIDNDGDIYVHGNCLCTCFDYSSQAKNKLQEIIKQENIRASQLNQVTLFFLEEIDIELEEA